MIGATDAPRSGPSDRPPSGGEVSLIGGLEGAEIGTIRPGTSGGEASLIGATKAPRSELSDGAHQGGEAGLIGTTRRRDRDHQTGPHQGGEAGLIGATKASRSGAPDGPISGWRRWPDRTRQRRHIRVADVPRSAPDRRPERPARGATPDGESALIGAAKAAVRGSISGRRELRDRGTRAARSGPPAVPDQEGEVGAI